MFKWLCLREMFSARPAIVALWLTSGTAIVAGHTLGNVRALRFFIQRGTQKGYIEVDVRWWVPEAHGTGFPLPKESVAGICIC